ncbi:hypothetical protein EUX98_g2985 [Antrodiella citrinella]|uniref:Protein kinase domain-containing protein n=1 Tax=Antrodiella citrinella TaxID=2447956 RepID=A0A4S4MXN2_9APHY|nr:hypothetical protein EUX98_g2985 [Antrodiella citrinella]
MSILASTPTATLCHVKDLQAYMLDVIDSRHYFPQFIWKFFLSNIGPRWQQPWRVHMFDIFTDVLHETRRIPQSKPIFVDFHDPDNLADDCLAAINHAEEAFARLEASVEQVLIILLHNLSHTTPSDTEEAPRRRTVEMDARGEHALLKYLVFLRFRNSDAYHETLNLRKKASESFPWMRLIPRGFRRRAVLRSICAFLDHEPVEVGKMEGSISGGGGTAEAFFADIEEHCWRPIREGRSEITVGIASEAQEFVTTERCFGDLDEPDPDGSYHLFFPITPTTAVYLMTRAPDMPTRSIPHMDDRSSYAAAAGHIYPPLVPPHTAQSKLKRKREHDRPESPSPPPPSIPQPKRSKSTPEPTLKRNRDENSDAATISKPGSSRARPPLSKRSNTDPVLARTGENESYVDMYAPARTVFIECDVETVPDVHIRNGILLRTSPRYILFIDLPSLITALTVTPLSSSPSSLSVSLNKLKTICRDKNIREGLMKTLLVKGSVPVVDLTDEVKLYGECAVEHGSFADIWKGEWVEKGVAGGGIKRVVAMKVLRQFMIDNIKEKLLKRLKDEVFTWHRLRHPHIASLYGIVQLPHHLAMISPWCDNGTVVHYLKDINPNADRILLMLQIASGVAYLHNFKPVVIHGDLKGNNILIDALGSALITDFGVSKVIEDFSLSSASSGSSPGSESLAASFFGGATRWMAPEIVLALVEDEGATPQLTKESDVYAFASVCLEAHPVSLLSIRPDINLSAYVEIMYLYLVKPVWTALILHAQGLRLCPVGPLCTSHTTLIVILHLLRLHIP